MLQGRVCHHLFLILLPLQEVKAVVDVEAGSFLVAGCVLWTGFPVPVQDVRVVDAVLAEARVAAREAAVGAAVSASSLAAVVPRVAHQGAMAVSVAAVDLANVVEVVVALSGPVALAHVGVKVVVAAWARGSQPE